MRCAKNGDFGGKQGEMVVHFVSAGTYGRKVIKANLLLDGSMVKKINEWYQNLRKLKINYFN